MSIRVMVAIVAYRSYGVIFAVSDPPGLGTLGKVVWSRLRHFDYREV